MIRKTHNKSLHWIFTPLRSVKTSEPGRYDEKFLNRNELFIKKYMQIHNYIINFWKASPYREYPKTKQKLYHTYWADHPGRIDLFAYKDKKHYCFEVKV